MSNINTITTDVHNPVVPATPLHQPFNTMAEGTHSDYEKTVACIHSASHGHMMAIPTDDEIIYITKQQAMDFFGLVDPVAQATPEETPYQRISDISLERIEELSKVAGHKQLPEDGNVMTTYHNSHMQVVFTRFAYLIAKELTKE